MTPEAFIFTWSQMTAKESAVNSLADSIRWGQL